MCFSNRRTLFTIRQIISDLHGLEVVQGRYIPDLLELRDLDHVSVTEECSRMRQIRSPLHGLDRSGQMHPSSNRKRDLLFTYETDQICLICVVCVMLR